jgi:hypothetical protein
MTMPDITAVSYSSDSDNKSEDSKRNMSILAGKKEIRIIIVRTIPGDNVSARCTGKFQAEHGFLQEKDLSRGGVLSRR